MDRMVDGLTAATAPAGGGSPAKMGEANNAMTVAIPNSKCMVSGIWLILGL